MQRKLPWEPRVTFDELAKIMVDYDVRAAGPKPIGEGMGACRSRGFRYTNHDFSLAEMLNEG